MLIYLCVSSWLWMKYLTDLPYILLLQIVDCTVQELGLCMRETESDSIAYINLYPQMWFYFWHKHVHLILQWPHLMHKISLCLQHAGPQTSKWNGFKSICPIISKSTWKRKIICVFSQPWLGTGLKSSQRKQYYFPTFLLLLFRQSNVKS